MGRMKCPGEGRGPCPGSHKSSLSTGSEAGWNNVPFISNPDILFFLPHAEHGVNHPPHASKFTQPYCLWALRSQESAWGCQQEGSCRLSLAQCPCCRCLGLKGQGWGGGAGEISICHSCQQALTQLSFTERQHLLHLQTTAGEEFYPVLIFHSRETGAELN